MNATVSEFRLDQRGAQNLMQKAAACAVVLHLILISSLPSISTWDLPFVEQGFRLNVVLEREPEPFEQSLQYPNSVPDDQASVSSSLNVASPAPGDKETEATESREVTGSTADETESNAEGLNATNAVSPKVFFSTASILAFARREAVRYADDNPDRLARFSRSFNSRHQYQRRKRTNSYKNRYGDQYVDNGSSSGDICFKKQTDKITTQNGTFDAPTYTVHFFRCKDKKTG